MSIYIKKDEIEEPLKLQLCSLNSSFGYVCSFIIQNHLADFFEAGLEDHSEKCFEVKNNHDTSYYNFEIILHKKSEISTAN